MCIELLNIICLDFCDEKFGFLPHFMYQISGEKIFAQILRTQYQIGLFRQENIAIRVTGIVT